MCVCACVYLFVIMCVPVRICCYRSVPGRWQCLHGLAPQSRSSPAYLILGDYTSHILGIITSHTHMCAYTPIRIYRWFHHNRLVGIPINQPVLVGKQNQNRDRNLRQHKKWDCSQDFHQSCGLCPAKNGEITKLPNISYVIYTGEDVYKCQWRHVIINADGIRQIWIVQCSLKPSPKTA